ncbi:flagellar assembly protein FliW [Vogesella indigofera]|jgi:flagellar assembly factor FliW|uniref:Flagellar assembly factor FliW n=1 Tax=Vogesella indigofera TaxID=45465 RepID=A0A495BID7_VOGIN|nr:flagellar assembly protein FliW [Vogesella indigofera]MDC7697831.1 flagellar assembly protein FliW [Vogesella indigofera]MDC7712244.1 flagellar assembly protein FliW [Vogesella indigofera]RKQ61110.1 flagellar assembly factor FliW [Vogesella indigofera]
MLFNSSLLGQVEVDENTIITFEAGLPAFENCTRFKLFHEADSDSPSVFWMQSLDNPDVLFSVTDPQKLGIRYEIELSQDEVAALALSRQEDAAILLTIYRELPSDEANPALSQLRANVRNPLIINLATQKALQKTGLACDIVFHNR